MKAFKGCINQSCGAYNKIRYKRNDQYCLKCGYTLSFVCAECWKPMESDENRLCTSCAALKEQKRAQFADKAKYIAAGVVGTMGAVAGTVKKVGDNAEVIQKGAKKMADAGANLLKIVKK